MTKERSRRIIEAIQECERFIAKEEPRRADLRPADVAVAMAFSSQPPETMEGVNQSVTGEYRLHEGPRTILPWHTANAWIELESYRDLDSDWDGPESLLPAASAIDAAQAFLAALPLNISVPEATISADGFVGLYWNRGDDFANVSFSSGGRLSYYARVKGAVSQGRMAPATGFVPVDLLELVKQI